MIHLTASARYGYGGKQYIARITGRDPKFTFRREFIGRKGGKRGEDSEADVDDAGLYEVRDVDNKGRPDDTYILVLETGPDEDDNVLVRTFMASSFEAMKIARALADGRALADVVEVIDAAPERRADRRWGFLTPRQAKTRDEGLSIDAVTEACWAALQALPERAAKKVLAALRLRVSPPRTPLSADAPVGAAVDAAQDAGATAEQVGMSPTPIQ